MMGRNWLELAKILLNGMAVGAALATFLGWAGHGWWVLELLDHPRPQYCLILLLALIANGLVCSPWNWLFGVPLVLNLALILPLFLPSGGLSANTQPGETLRLLHINLDRHNTQFERVTQYIQSQKADLVFLQEVTPTWLTRLESDLSQYRTVISRPQDNTQGVALLVQSDPSPSVEVLATQILHLPSDSHRPLIEARIRWGETEAIALSLHVIRSRNASTSKFQQVEFDAVTRWYQQKPDQAIVVIGDFNTTPWSSRFRTLLREGAWVNSQRGFGLQSTWLASLPPPLRIAIDHCIHSESISTLKRKIGPAVGSDHLPLWVELGWNQR